MAVRLSPWERRIVASLLAVVTVGLTVVNWITLFHPSTHFWYPTAAVLGPLGTVVFIGMVLFPLPGKQLTPLWGGIILAGLAAGAVNLVLELHCAGVL